MQIHMEIVLCFVLFNLKNLLIYLFIWNIYHLSLTCSQLGTLPTTCHRRAQVTRFLVITDKEFN